MKKLIQYTFAFLLTIGANFAMAHGGEDHGDAKPKAPSTPKNYFTTSGVSDVYELLLRYEPIKPNEETHLKLSSSGEVISIVALSTGLLLSKSDRKSVV